MEKKRSPVIIIALLIILVLIIGVITFLIQRKMPTKERADLKEYYQISEDTQTALVVNEQVLDAKAIESDGKTYIDFDTVSQYINERFYYDGNEGKLIVTTPSEIVTMLTADADKADFFVQDNVGYLSLDYVKSYTSMECEQLKDPERLVITTTDDANDTCVDAEEDTQVRIKGGIKSPILTDVTAKTSLKLLETLDNWSKVATLDGYIGYVENDKISESYQAVAAVDADTEQYTSISKDYKINLAWHQVTADAANASISDILATAKINTISPTWFSIKDNDGNITTYADPEYVKTAHAAGVEVWGLVDNFSTEISSLEILSHTTSRINLITNLMNEAQRVGLDGINVDLELISEETAPHYIQFIRELGIACRKAQIVLSVDDPVPQPYSMHYDRKEQGIVADYVIIMGYDEHTSGSTEAGSVASIEFVKSGIEETLKEVPANKIINGIPFYTRLWTTDTSGALSSEVFGMDGADEYVQTNGLDEFWDTATGQNYAEKEDDTGLYQIWLEDEKSIEEKMKLVQDHDLAGAAFWKLGFQRSAIWDVIAGYLS